MTKSIKNRILWISIPVLALLAAITISGYLNLKAEQLDAYQINGNVLLGYNGTEKDITIPESAAIIGDSAFEENQVIQKVIISEGVTEIGQSAFKNCNQLKEVQIPDSVLYIADSAFDGCDNLNTVSIGNGLAELGNGVFSDCDSLKDIKIDNNSKFKCQNGVLTDQKETTIYQFLAGNGITSYKMPDNITEIKPYAFWGCDNLKGIHFSSGLNKVDAYAVAECKGLETVILQEPLREICMGAFGNDTALKEIVIPVSVTNIHDSAFTAVPLELKVTCQEGSFAEDYAAEQGYTSDITGDSPTIHTVSTDSFQGENESVASQSNNSVSIESEQNSSTQENEDIIVTDDNTQADDIFTGTELGNSIIVSDRVFVMMDSPTEWENSGNNLDNSVVTAFESINDRTNKIQDYSYYQNSQIYSLEDVGIPETVTEIGQFAFARSSIESAFLPEGIKTIGYGAFYHADNLKEVDIPASVTYIDSYAFLYTPWLENWKKDSKEDFLVVGDGILIAYKGTEKSVIIPENVKYIASYTFADNQRIEEICLPEGLVKIESYAFSGCKKLSKIGYLDQEENKELNTISSDNAFVNCPILDI